MPAAQIARRLGGALRRRLRQPQPPLTFDGVAGPIHLDDDMLEAHDVRALHYASVGHSAVAAIAQALAAVDRSFADVQACLDMPCGYGRVLRVLIKEIPAQRITACDINGQAVRFCASQFGARPLRASRDIDRTGLGHYDLIWCGSLVTHIDERSLERLLRSFARALLPAGLAIITIHGDPPSFGPDVPLREEIAAALEQHGQFHVPYEDALFGYGTAWHTKQYLCDAFAAASDDSVALVSHARRGWDGYQDVLAFRRER